MKKRNIIALFVVLPCAVYLRRATESTNSVIASLILLCVSVYGIIDGYLVMVEDKATMKPDVRKVSDNLRAHYRLGVSQMIGGAFIIVCGLCLAIFQPVIRGRYVADWARLWGNDTNVTTHLVTPLKTRRPIATSPSLSSTSSTGSDTSIPVRVETSTVAATNSDGGGASNKAL